MPIISADTVILLTDTTKTAGDIEGAGIIPIVQERIRVMCRHNFIVSGIAITSALTFNATAATIVAGASYVSQGFAADDEFYLSGSFRNDGYYTIASVTTVTITIASTATVIDELSGATVLISLTRWPDDLPYAVAQFIKYDLEDRLTKGGGLSSQTIGPRSESYNEMTYGYPTDLLSLLDAYRRPTFG